MSSRQAKQLEKKATEAAGLLQSMANPRRLMILCELAQGERSVGALVRIVGLQQAALSQHLARLRSKGLVRTRRQAQMVFYRLASPAVTAIIETLAALFCAPGKSKKGSKS
jgi:DNA-binding transcriptional ArsR family regulator